MRKFRKMTACAQIRHEFSPILKSHPKKVDFGKHTFQSRCSHLLGVQISCNFVQIRAISWQFRAISRNGWRAVSAAMFLACKFRAISCNFVQRLACGFCGDVLGVQTSCNFVRFRATAGVQFANFVQIRGPMGVRVLEQSFGKPLGVQISCKFAAPLACKFCGEVCAMFGHAKFCEITRNFANFRAICLCADMLGKESPGIDCINFVHKLLGALC